MPGDDPSAEVHHGRRAPRRFGPYPFKILEVPGMVAILYEAIQGYRQIFTDGRALPRDPNPAWMGYSVGRWEGDVFVVESSGFNDDVWLDNKGHPATGALRVTERFVRQERGPDGHRDHDRRSERLHAAVERHAAAGAAARDGTARGPSAARTTIAISRSCPRSRNERRVGG